MIRLAVLLTLIAGLSACAGGTQYSSQRAIPRSYYAVTPGAKPVQVEQIRFAAGPIYSACRNAGRKSASRERCGCVQWVADRELSNSQQRRGAGYFQNQGKLQEIRQSDAPANETFWKAWKAYGQKAQAQCRGS